MKKKFMIISLVSVIALATLVGCGKTESDNKDAVSDIPVVTENPTNDDSNTADSFEPTESVEPTKKPENNELSVAVQLTEDFNKADFEDAYSMAEHLSGSGVFNEIGMGTMEVTPGYLNGFDNEINGFDKGFQFSPIIGSIPMVGYVFETEDPKALVGELKANANLRWNICTSADEMKTEIKDNLVLFVMAPISFGE